MKKKKTDWIAEDIQSQLKSRLEAEYVVANRNQSKLNKDIEIFYNMMHSIRDEKPNEWESDISLPEFSSRIMTQIGNFVAQYFSSTDYVEADIDSDDPKDVAESKAAKNLLNTILKDKENYYYHKIVRLIMAVFTDGYGIIKGSYEQQTRDILSYYKHKSQYRQNELGEFMAADGTPYADPMAQTPLLDEIDEPVYNTEIVKDRPTFDVYPNQNVYMSPEYVYSLNDKQYIYFETEKSLDALHAEKEQMGYFNLHLLKDVDPGEHGEKTYNKDCDYEEPDEPVSKVFTIMERWGKYPVVEKDGQYIPGINKDGKVLDEAKNEECIIHYAKKGDEILQIIGFRKSRHSKRPMARFLCYVDTTSDNGFGDGEMIRELQIAANDNYNLMNYRTRLATTPFFKGKKFASVPDKIHVDPESVLMLDDINDLAEVKIEDNIQGGIYHQNLLASRMDYVMATSPQTMGMSPERGETATMASIINQRANIRIGMKSMNLEFIGFAEFYDMILILCNDFMLPETLEKMLGEDAYSYNPKRKDKFKPVSQALQSEDSKQFKIKSLQTVASMVQGVPNPKTPQVLNYLIGEILETMGGSFKAFKKYMFEEDPTKVALYQIATGSKGGGSAPNVSPMAPTANQSGIPQGATQQAVRTNQMGAQ